MSEPCNCLTQLIGIADNGEYSEKSLSRTKDKMERRIGDLLCEETKTILEQTFATLTKLAKKEEVDAGHNCNNLKKARSEIKSAFSRYSQLLSPPITPAPMELPENNQGSTQQASGTEDINLDPDLEELEEMIVEKIVEHNYRGEKGAKPENKRLTFKVTWKGYSDKLSKEILWKDALRSNRAATKTYLDSLSRRALNTLISRAPQLGNLMKT